MNKALKNITIHLVKKLDTLSYRFLLLVLLSVFIYTASSAQEKQAISTDTTKVVKIAVRAHSGLEAARNKWTATADYLSNSIQGYTFQILPFLTFDEMRSAIANREVEFVLTNPTAYIDLSVNYSLTRIATLINRREKGGFAEFGSVIFTRADRNDINLLSDVSGKSIMGVHKEAFGGWQMAYFELLEIGIDPFQDCAEVLFSPNRTQEKIVLEVLENKVDIGTVRTGILEKMSERGEIDLNALKIIEPINDNFPLPHSTRLYPEWPFSSLETTDIVLAKKVTIALLQIEKESKAAVRGGYTAWKVPLSYNQVLLLLKTLRVAPFEDYGEVSVSDFIKLYWQWFLFSFLIFLGLFMLVIYISGLNKKLFEARSKLEEKVEERTVELNKNILLLKKQQSTLKSAEEIGNTGSWELDLLKNELLWSDQVYKIFAISVGTPMTFEIFADCIHPDDIDYVNSEWEAALKGKDYSIEHRILIDGKTKWVREKAKVVFDKNNTAISAIGFTQDITQNKLTEEELAKHRIHLEELVKTRTSEIETKNTELSRFNKLFVDREFRIKELRDKVKELEEKARNKG